MGTSVFNPNQQEQETASKIVAGLERISEAFKVLLWDKAKQLGLSPIQIQILIFIAYHKQELCNVSHLAKEFNITKPTISDAVRVLVKKELVFKNYLPTDSRSYTIVLSDTGMGVLRETEQFSNPLKNHVSDLPTPDLEQLFFTLSKLIYQLNQHGILQVQRTCFGCKFYQKNNDKHFCNLLDKELLAKEIRLDCPEYI